MTFLRLQPNQEHSTVVSGTTPSGCTQRAPTCSTKKTKRKREKVDCPQSTGYSPIRHGLTRPSEEIQLQQHNIKTTVDCQQSTVVSGTTPSGCSVPPLVQELADTPSGCTDTKIFGKEILQTTYHNIPSVELTDLDVALKSRARVISCLAGLPSHLHLLHHDPRLTYSLFCGSRLVLRDRVRGKKRRRIRSRRRRPHTCQRNGESHRSPSGVATILSYGLRRRSRLGGLVSRRPLVPPHSQRFVVVIIREIDNMRGYKGNIQSTRVAINVQSNQSGTSVIVPGLEVTASSISWSSSLAEISEVAALQISKVSQLAQ